MGRFKNYERDIYTYLFLSAIILFLASALIPQAIVQGITLNLGSDLLAGSLLFFIFRFSQRQEQKRQEQVIRVVLEHDDTNVIELPFELRRADLTRAEVLGRIGMLPMKEEGKRFSLGYLSTARFLRRINEISESDREETLTIRCNKDEFDKFDRSKIEQLRR